MVESTEHPDHAGHSAHAADIAVEQAYVDELFARIDADVIAANERLRDVMLRVDRATPDPEALVEREVEYHALNDKLDTLTVAQLGLVFGRITLDNEQGDDDVRYIGRMGIDAPEDHYRTLLLDWRAPMARPFYIATTANPEGVTTRRHIRTTGRTVVDIHDEQLVGDASDESASDVVSESALLRALNAARTAHMGNIVETIQREQDDIIRDPERGVMVVEGGPGTGKTAVALHRVAYLLYTWRDVLARSGVLIVGPNHAFLDYISRVLPELGETGVVLTTVGEMYPGVTPIGTDSLLAREVKGSAEMVHILRTAVQAYQTVPAEPVPLFVDGLTLHLTPAMVTTARGRARRSGLPHNQARAIFRDQALDLLAHAMADMIGADPLGGTNLLSSGDIAQLHEDLADEFVVDSALDELWPELTPQDVLEELLESPERISVAAADYDEDTQSALYREDGAAWSAADAALLDELAQLLGTDDPEQERKVAEQRWQEQIEEAQDALDILTGSASQDLDDGFDAEILMAHDVIDAETLAQRQEIRDNRSTAERAKADRLWAYGHVVVDEAQELSPMAWRMIMRRCPSRWMTLVGDTAQTGSPAGVDSWTDTLEPYVQNRFRRHQLTVNYRTPADIMDVANTLLPMIAPTQTPSQAVRSTGIPVRFLPSGTEVSPLIDALRTEHPDRLTAHIDANNVAEIKGLEYDHVVLVEPQEIVGNSPQGWQDLYVALTRATQSLTVVGEMPTTEL